jgi:hypothetical protein
MGNKPAKQVYLEKPTPKEEINANLLNKPDKIIIKVYEFTVFHNRGSGTYRQKECYFPQFDISISESYFSFNSCYRYSYPNVSELKIMKPKLLKTIELTDNQEIFDFICMKYKVKDKESEIYSIMSRLLI